MPMKQLILVRHAESESNVDRDLYFQKDKYDHTICLSEKGKKQAARCASDLEGLITSSYTAFVSPYKRAQEKFELIKMNLKEQPESVIFDGRLREQEFKAFKDKDDYVEKNERRKARGRMYYRFKNAESGYDVLNRVGGFYNQLRTDWMLGNRKDTVLIVTHEIVIRCFLMLALDLPPEKVEDRIVKNCEIIHLIALENLKFRLV